MPALAALMRAARRPARPAVSGVRLQIDAGAGASRLGRRAVVLARAGVAELVRVTGVTARPAVGRVALEVRAFHPAVRQCVRARRRGAGPLRAALVSGAGGGAAPAMVRVDRGVDTFPGALDLAGVAGDAAVAARAHLLVFARPLACSAVGRIEIGIDAARLARGGAFRAVGGARSAAADQAGGARVGARAAVRAIVGDVDADALARDERRRARPTRIGLRPGIRLGAVAARADQHDQADRAEPCARSPDEGWSSHALINLTEKTFATKHNVTNERRRQAPKSARFGDVLRQWRGVWAAPRQS